MNMVLLMMNAMQQLANVHVKKISPMTNAVNVLKVSSDFQIAKVSTLASTAMPVRNGTLTK